MRQLAKIFATSGLLLLAMAALVAGGNLSCYAPSGDDIKEANEIAISYDYSKKNPRYVIYELAPGNNGLIKRDKFSFYAEPGTAKPSEYAKTGYDLGHMKPAEDSDKDENTMHACFTMRNICPQLASVNRGDWKELEEQLRKEAVKERIIVVCGPYYDSGINKTIGHGTFIPSGFFKVAYYPDLNILKGWIYPNSEHVNLHPKDYESSIDNIRSKTGYDFSRMIKHVDK